MRNLCYNLGEDCESAQYGAIRRHRSWGILPQHSGDKGGIKMRKNLGANPYVYPQPVLIVATYGEDGTVDAMNVAYGGIVNSNRIQINIGVRHKTSDNIKLEKGIYSRHCR